jgi:hypothetical protein
LIGIRTLDQLRCGNVLDAAARIKVKRDEVKHIIWSTLWRYPRRRGWADLFRQNQDNLRRISPEK